MELFFPVLAGMDHNIFFAKAKEGKLAPFIELELIISEQQHDLTRSGSIEHVARLNTLKYVLSYDGLRQFHNDIGRMIANFESELKKFAAPQEAAQPSAPASAGPRLVPANEDELDPDLEASERTRTTE